MLPISRLPAALTAALTLVIAFAGLALLPGSAHASEAVLVRMTTDVTSVTDSSGNVWEPRSTTLGSTTRSARLLGQPIAGTTEDRLYQVVSWAVTGYRTSVPATGAYRVRLLLVEDHFREPGKRVFDVKAEGRTAAGDIDVIRDAGYATAHDVVFETQVTDGALDLQFVARVDFPQVAAIEVTALPHPQFDTEVLRVSTGAAATHDTQGRRWDPSFGFTGPIGSWTGASVPSIGGTTDDVLFMSAAAGMTGWSVRVPDGTYRVRLLMTEPKWNAVGKRVFDVTAEGRAALVDVDIFKAVGLSTAYAPSLEATVDDGRLDLGFVAKADAVRLCAIEVTRLQTAPEPTGDPTVSPTPTPTDDPNTPPGGGPSPVPSESTPPAVKQIFTSRMVAAPQPVTDSAGAVWNRWSATLGSWNLSTKLAGKDIGGTTQDQLYRSNVWGPQGYILPVPEATSYRVRLMMAEDSFYGAGKRVFDVRAEGGLVASNVDIAAAVGTGKAHDVTFEVTVSDGELDLAFVNRVDLPLISAIEVTSTTPVAVPEPGPKRAVKLAADSFFTTEITDAPLAENSAAIAEHIAGQVRARYNGIAAFNAYHYNLAAYSVPANRKRVTVDYACGASPPPNLYDGKGYFLDVPIPDTAAAARGNDGAMSIYDRSSDQLWNFWQMRHDPTTDRWSACWGGRIDEVSKNPGIFPKGYGASASGIAQAPGVVTLDEVKRGRIDHAVVVSMPAAAKSLFSWPGNRTDGTSSDPAAPAEGQRLRLDPNLDLDSLALSPIGRMVAEAAQRYGFILTDTGGAVAVTAESGEPSKNVTKVDPWNSIIGQRDWEVMRNFPWHRIQALPIDYGRPGGSSGS